MFQDQEYELINTALGAGTNIMRELSKAVADNPDKYSFDLNHLYKKYEIASKAEQAKSFIQTQVKKKKKIVDFMYYFNLDSVFCKKNLHFTIIFTIILYYT